MIYLLLITRPQAFNVLYVRDYLNHQATSIFFDAIDINRVALPKHCIMAT
jgi:hypothetical protein